MPVAEHLLDGNEIHTPFIVVCGTCMPKPVRAEPLLGRAGLEQEQVTKAIADRASVDRAAAFVAEQRL